MLNGNLHCGPWFAEPPLAWAWACNVGRNMGGNICAECKFAWLTLVCNIQNICAEWKSALPTLVCRTNVSLGMNLQCQQEPWQEHWGICAKCKFARLTLVCDVQGVFAEYKSTLQTLVCQTTIGLGWLH